LRRGGAGYGGDGDQAEQQAAHAYLPKSISHHDIYVSCASTIQLAITGPSRLCDLPNRLAAQPLPA
jgi:hypothetical protein